MTDRLYERDSYCNKFNAVVCECTPMDGKYGVVLDRTAFFPEGGGQAADKGTIHGIPVVDVQRKGTVVIHVLETELPVGEEVSCELDWELRYSRMQGHTGEHILSGVVNALYGYDNVGFHMGDSVMIVDFNGRLSAEDVKKIELAANKAVYTNADIVVSYPSVEELETMRFRSKIELAEDLRIVSIGENIDCCACCAPHVAKTGEVGIIKVLDFYSYKQGTRIEMVAGINALTDYMSLNVRSKELMKMLSVPREGIVEAVREKNTAYQNLYNDYQKNVRKLALYELDPVEVGASVCAVTEGLSFDELRYCANQLTERDYSVCMLFSKNGVDEYAYVISSKSKDIRGLAGRLNETFSGKGGGQPGYAQGKLSVCEEVRLKAFVEELLQSEI